jgi:translation elongation factor EF-G
VRAVLSGGAIAGFELQDVRVSVYDGKHHPVDSKDIAFQTAGRLGFLDAMAKAQPVLLEPYVDIEVTVPDEYIDLSALIGDEGHVRERIQVFEDVGVTYLNVTPHGPDPLETIEKIKSWAE